MTLNLQPQVPSHLSAGGHTLSDSGWLDVHFEACAPEYEVLVRSAGFSKGDLVLDAGCGSGSFLPLLEHLAGRGNVTAMDVVVEPSAVRKGCQSVGGSVLTIPFEDATFDGVWCGNVLQYVPELDVQACLTELMRVVRPGGRVAIKDVDMTAWRVAPGDPFLGLRLADANYRSAERPESRGSVIGRVLGSLMREAGFEGVMQTSLFIERTAPLTAIEVDLWANWLSYLASLAETADVSLEDRLAWREITRNEGRDFVCRPDFYGCEAQTLAVGIVPH